MGVKRPIQLIVILCSHTNCDKKDDAEVFHTKNKGANNLENQNVPKNGNFNFRPLKYIVESRKM